MIEHPALAQLMRDDQAAILHALQVTHPMGWWAPPVFERAHELYAADGSLTAYQAVALAEQEARDAS